MRKATQIREDLLKNEEALRADEQSREMKRLNHVRKAAEDFANDMMSYGELFTEMELQAMWGTRCYKDVLNYLVSEGEFVVHSYVREESSGFFGGTKEVTYFSINIPASRN